MRGCKPQALTLSLEDRRVLEHLARRRQAPWFQVQRAKVLLAMADGERRITLAAGSGCDRTTLWRLARDYQDHGLPGLLTERPRTGAPPAISPPPSRPDRRPGLPRAGGPGPAHHPLDQ